MRIVLRICHLPILRSLLDLGRTTRNQLREHGICPLLANLLWMCKGNKETVLHFSRILRFSSLRLESFFCFGILKTFSVRFRCTKIFVKTCWRPNQISCILFLSCSDDSIERKSDYSDTDKLQQRIATEQTGGVTRAYEVSWYGTKNSRRINTRRTAPSGVCTRVHLCVV